MSCGKAFLKLVKLMVHSIFYLSFQELDRSLYYRLWALVASDGADNLRKAGLAAHSGQIGSGHLPHRSLCTAKEWERRELCLLSPTLSSLRSVASNRRKHDIHDQDACRWHSTQPGQGIQSKYIQPWVSCVVSLVEKSWANAIAPESVSPFKGTIRK